MSHYWPSIGPLNVWDLPYDMWLMYVQAAKDLRAQQKAQAEGR